MTLGEARPEEENDQALPAVSQQVSKSQPALEGVLQRVYSSW